jgi:amino acid transporter
MQNPASPKSPDTHQSEVSEDTGSRKLQSNALGLLSTAALTAAYMGPALSIYTLFGSMDNVVGAGVGFVMIIATALTLLSAVSFGMLAKEIPSAGGVYAWTRAAFGESIGLWVGISTAIYYTICLFFPPIIFGDFFNEILNQTGIFAALNIKASSATWLVGALILLGFGAFIAYRGVVVSANFAFTLLIIELAVIAALAGTFLYTSVQNETFSLAPITFTACKNGWSGVFLALPMAFLCVVCDAATPAAEETKNAKWTIPVAVIMTCLFIGIWYVVGFSAFALAKLPSDVTTPGQDPVPMMVTRAWGKWGIIVSLTAMTAALGAFIPGITASSRVIFAMAREGKLPHFLAVTHPKYKAPWNALHLAFILTALSVIPAVLYFGSIPTIVWWGYVVGWFIGVVYVFANLVNVVYYWQNARDRFSILLNLVIPIFAMIVHLVIIVQSVGVELWQLPDNSGKSVQAFIAFVCIASTAYVVYVQQRTRTEVEFKKTRL